MLCLHGNPTWSYLWRRFLAEAPPGWRVIAPDQLGMGWSERLQAPRRMADRIEDLNRLTETLGVRGPVVVVAHDWGGPIALGWALGHLDQVAGVVLTNTGVALPDGSAPRPDPAGPVPGAPTDGLRVHPDLRPRRLGAVPSDAAGRGPRRPGRSLRHGGMRASAIGDFVADIPIEPDHPSRAALDRVAAGLAELGDVPVLLLWGPRDPVFSERYLQRSRPAAAARLDPPVRRRLPSGHRGRARDAPSTPGPGSAIRSTRRAIDRAAPSVESETSRGPHSGRGSTARAGDDGVATVELSANGARVTSFADLERRVAALAAGLVEAGVRPGDRVALLVRPGLDLTASVYACWRVGAAIVLADAGLGLRNLGSALRSADPDHLIAIPAGLAVAAALRIPGQRIVAGSLPGPARRLLRVDHSLDELRARLGPFELVEGPRVPTRWAPFDKLRERRSWRRRCCSPRVPRDRPRESSTGTISCGLSSTWCSW